MKTRRNLFLRIETYIIIIIFVAFSLTWISWGKLIVSGWDVPYLYKKMTNISNTVMFFSKRETPHLAFIFYISPFLASLSFVFLLIKKYRIANFILLLSTIFGIVISVYMYNYFLFSKIFKLSNSGIGIHILLFVSLIGVIYSAKHCRKKKQLQPEITIPETETQNTISE